MTRHDPGRKGGPRDPVAQNIRNEQMRDAMPSAEEAEREHRERLGDEGCEVCDERDPDELSIAHPYVPPCAAYPNPPMSRDIRVFCDEHRRQPHELWWAKRVHGARKQGAVAIVEYACGATDYATRDGPPDFNTPGIETWQDIPPSHRPVPEVPVQCQCGETIDDVHMLGGVE